MTRFLLKRLLQGLVVLLGLTILTFILLRLLPGGPAAALAGTQATPERIRAINEDFGLTKPVPIQYGHWISHLVRGDLGQSYQQGVAVTDLLGQYLPRTLRLLGAATLLSLICAIPIAVFQAVHRNTKRDYGLTLLAFFGYSMPLFWFGLVLILVFAINLHWLPAGGVTDPGESESNLLSVVRHLVLPSAMLSLSFIAAWSRYIRASMLDALVQDFIRTARAKGAGQRRVRYLHALPNALIPVITLLGASLPFMLSGSLVTEVVFNYPGMGLLFWNAAQAQDYPILMGVILVLGAGTVVGNLVADVLHAIADPRIRHGALGTAG
jgi:peptide/nickel transport system permease protein